MHAAYFGLPGSYFQTNIAMDDMHLTPALEPSFNEQMQRELEQLGITAAHVDLVRTHLLQGVPLVLPQ